MTSKFCELKKDKKTFNILKRYIKDINCHIDLLNEDNQIQIEEIKKHQFNTGKNGLNWIEKHAESERIYLNTIKIIAHDWRFLYKIVGDDIKIKKTPGWEQFLKLCECINDDKELILNKIY